MPKVLLRAMLFSAVFPWMLWGCSCVTSPPSASSYFTDKDTYAIFVGVVDDIKIISATKTSPLRRVYTIQVYSVLRGEVASVVRVFGTYDGKCDHDVFTKNPYVFTVVSNSPEVWLGKDLSEKFHISRGQSILQPYNCRSHSLATAQGMNFLDDLQQEAIKASMTIKR